MTGPDAIPATGTAAIPQAFQILITSDTTSSANFTPRLQLNQQSLRQPYPGYQHRMMGNDEIRALLADHFDADVLAAYDALLPFAFKADLARYCLLYQFGGLYSDLSYLHLHTLELAPDQSLILFHDVASRTPHYALSNSIILARPRHRLMEKAIRQIVAHHHAGFVGKSPLDPTGPTMLGRVNLTLRDDTSAVIGTTHLINRDTQGRYNTVKLLPDGRLVALRNKGTDASIHELVPSGGNDYGTLWRKGMVWEGHAPKPPNRSVFRRLVDWADRQLREA